MTARKSTPNFTKLRTYHILGTCFYCACYTRILHLQDPLHTPARVVAEKNTGIVDYAIRATLVRNTTMCGIYASISTRAYRHPSEAASHLLCNRGPDHIGESHTQVDLRDGRSCRVSLVSTVLALRGGHITAQPFTDALSGSSLCWNGEAWKIGSDAVVGNDGQAIFDLLMRASSAQATSEASAAATIKLLQSIAGPFAFVFVDKVHDQVYFGRDRLGRRSLLYKNNGSSTCLELSSMADPSSGPWSEVEADAIYQLSYNERNALNDSQSLGSKTDLLSNAVGPMKMHLWDDDSSPFCLGTFNRAVPGERFPLNVEARSVTQLKHHLSESLKLRVLNVPLPPGYSTEHKHQVRVAVLFSGGLDCTVLARMAHDILPSDQHIDLINVAFENPRVVKAAKNTSISKKNTNDENKNPSLSSTKPMIDDLSPYENCPDRETGRKALEELKTVCSGRTWRFIAVNVPYKETQAHRSNVVNLIYPHNTEMDLSIGYALYFAARGSGLATTSHESSPIPYTTRARVLLSGLGADELFGGYTRHATAFSRHGFPGLLDELKLDVDRLGKRNLGRDDRIISHWGREARFPYLDEALVKWAVECPIWGKCGFELDEPKDKQIPDIEPGKKILRLLAYDLGMHSVAMEKKRAIQFGARTAKMEVGRTKGTNLIS